MKKAMKFGFVLMALIGFSQVSVAQTGGPESNTVVTDGPVITVDKDVHDYGTIEQGDNGECVFVVTNTGTAPLIINKCQGSCGCTVPTCPQEPIAPGASAEIKVKYDTNRVGPINKSVTITSNAGNAPQLIIRIKGNIKAKPQGGAPVNGGTGTPLNN